MSPFNLLAGGAGSLCMIYHYLSDVGFFLIYLYEERGALYVNCFADVVFDLNYLRVEVREAFYMSNHYFDDVGFLLTYLREARSVITFVMRVFF